MPVYDKEPPSTSDPRKLSAFLSEQSEYLRYIFSNIGTENLSEELYELIVNISNRLGAIEEKLNALLGTAEEEE